MTWWGVQAAIEDNHIGSWNVGDGQIQSELAQVYDHISNSQNDVAEEDKSLYGEHDAAELDLEHDVEVPSPYADDKRDYNIYEKSAHDRRARAKSRMMSKHNKQVSKVYSNLTKERQKKYQDTFKYPESSRNIMRENMSRYKSKSSSFNNYGNDLSHSKTRVIKPNEYSVPIDSKADEYKNSLEREIMDFPAAARKNSKLNWSHKEMAEVLENNANGTSYVDYITEKHFSGHKQKPRVHINYQKDTETEGEIISPVRKHNKNKNMSDKFYKTNKNNNNDEEHDNKDYTEKLRRNHLNRLIKIKPNSEDTEQSDLSKNTEYTNVSVINQGFLGAVEKKYALHSGSSSKHKTKTGLRDLLTTKPVFNNELTHGSMLNFLDEDNNKHVKNVPNTDENYNSQKMYKGHISNDLLYNQERNETMNENNNIIPYSNKEKKFKSEDKNSNIIPSDTYLPLDETSVQSRPFKSKKPLEQKNPSTNVLSETDQEDIKNAKHNKRRGNKKVNTEESELVVANRARHSLHTSKKHPLAVSEKDEANTASFASDILLESRQEIQNKRSERGIRKNNHRLTHHRPDNTPVARNALNSFSSSDTNDLLLDSDAPEDERNSSPEYYDTEEGHQRKAHRLDEDNRYLSNYSDPTASESSEEPENVESKDDSNKVFGRRVHESRYNEDQSDNTYTCVEYKEERATRVTKEAITITTENVKTTCTTKVNNNIKPKTTSTPKRNNNTKTKTTPKTSSKSQSTKKSKSEIDQSSTPNVVIDSYEQFLCGQLADNFVSTVLTKVQRSRKILNELGFSNVTEETCERCIETRPNKIPDLETMRLSLGKCSKSSGSKQNCSRCYNVPKLYPSMGNFLNLLLSFGKDHENSVYNKIQDDSSFIFTGDYPESLTRTDNGIAIHDKYIGDRDSFNKDTFEKQHLREEGNEEKSEGQSSNRNNFENVRHKPPEEENHVEDSTAAAFDENEDQEIETETKSNPQKSAKEKEAKDEYGDQNSLQSDENLKGSDLIDVFDSQDLISPLRGKYSTFKDSGPDSSPTKRRGNVYKNDKFQSLPNSFSNSREPETKLERNRSPSLNNNQQYSNRNYDVFNLYPEKCEQSQYRSVPSNTLAGSRQNMYYGKINQGYENTLLEDGRLLNERDKYSPPHSALQKGINRDSQNHNYYGYPPKEFIAGNQFNRKVQKSVSDDVMNKDWKNSEYQFDPKQQSRNVKKNSQNIMSRPINYVNDYDERLGMVKRDAEPANDGETLLFEIPDVEYDLY